MSGNETLLDIAVHDLMAAKILYNHKSDDETLLNQIGYFLQQSVELSLKHHLEMQAIEYPRTHDIEDLLSLLPDQEDFEYVDNLSGKITSLESKTRYIKNFKVSKKTVDKVMKVAEKLIRDIQQKENVEVD